MVLLTWFAGAGNALEWNPVDELIAPDGPIRRHVPFVGARQPPAQLPPVFIYSASRQAMMPARALFVPLPRRYEDEGTVERLASEYARAIAPMMEYLRLPHRPAPTEVPDPAFLVLAQIRRDHEAQRRLNDSALRSRLSELDVNLVLVVEVPAYRQYWGEQHKLTEVDVSITGYECERGTAILSAREVVRGSKSHAGETFEVLEARVLARLVEKTRDRLVDLESERRAALAAAAIPEVTPSQPPPNLSPAEGVTI